MPADNFLAPGGDYGPVGSFCGVRDPHASQDFILAVDTAAELVRAACGPVLLETGLAHTTRRTTDTLVLPFRPATLTSITASGAALTVADFYADGQMVRRVDGGSIPPVTVVYTSGWSTVAEVPARLVMAGKEVTRHLWRTQLGNQRNGDEQAGAWPWPKQQEMVAADLRMAADLKLAPLGFA